MKEITLKKALINQDSRLYNKQIDEKDINELKTNIDKLIQEIKNAENSNQQEHEPRYRDLFQNFLKNNFYYEDCYTISSKRYIDSCIEKNGKIQCIVEIKTPNNVNDMINNENFNKKALYEIIAYYINETRDTTNPNNRIKKNEYYDIKKLMITNLVDYYIFSKESIENIVKGDIEDFFFENNDLKKEEKYKYLKQYFNDNPDKLDNLEYVHFNIFNTENQIQNIHKILSKYYLLNERQQLQFNSHTLNDKFYKEILYIMGLSEIKEKDKKIIKIDKKINNSMGEQVLKRLLETDTIKEEKAEEKAIELLIIWIDRILFIKLFEAQLIYFNGDEKRYHLLDTEKLHDFEDLRNLFFNVLGKNYSNRVFLDNEFYNQFKDIPYLNSKLFEEQKAEEEGIKINEIKNIEVKLMSNSVLKNKNYKSLPLLNYIIDFLNCYDFGAKKIKEGIKEKSKDIIDASVLGLIFEKLNGYKDGAVYTPSQITSFMAQQVVERCVLKRINKELKWNCKDLDELIFRINVDSSKELFIKINDIINSITYLDPAVGSGHLLVSILNWIIYIKFKLGILMYWEFIGSEKVYYEPVKNFNIYIEDDTLMVTDTFGEQFRYDKYNSISQKMQKTLFNEKKTIIEKCLFGADISKNAVNICQLRFWIELLKNAYYKEDNRMQTLPNIDINIKCGNSLISKIPFEVEEKIELKKYLKDVKDTVIDKYRKFVKQYIVEEDKYTKSKIKEFIDDFENFNIHNKYYEENTFDLLGMQNYNKEDEEEKEIYRNSLEWALVYPEITEMVLTKNGRIKANTFKGFDCIIGNPPYIPISKLKSDAKKYKKMGYETLNNNGDIYCLFFELAKRLIKKDGIIELITSNKWMRAKYGKELRNFLVNKLNPQLLINFGGTKIFDGVEVNVDILLLENNQYNKKTNSYKANEHSLKNLNNAIKKDGRIIDFSDQLTWIIMSKYDQRIKEKIDKIGTPLQEWKIDIKRGILTGKNEAFEIDEKTKNMIIQKDKNSQNIIVPILKGRNIKPYRINFEQLWLICTHNGYANKERIHVEKYPAIKEWLDRFYNDLEKRKDQGDTPYNLRNCAFMDDFKKEKIIYPETTSGAQFVYDTEGYYIDKTCYFIIGEHLKYIQATLSSKLFEYSYKNIYSSIELGDTGYQYNEHALKLLPIKIPTEKEETEIIKIIEKINEDPRQENIEKLNNKIYHMYEICEEEIEYINNNL